MQTNKYGINYLYFFATLLLCSIPYFVHLLGFDLHLNNKLVDLSSVNIINELGQVENLSPLLKGKFIHTIIVSVSITIAFVITILSFIDYIIKKNVSTPIVGIALFCSGMLDFVHIISSNQIIHYELNNIDISSFTWLFSRVFHALILILGVGIFLLQGKESFIEEYKSEKYFVGFIGFIFFLLSINAVLIVTDKTLEIPTMVYPNSTIAHPFDLIPLVLYVFAGIYVFPKYYQLNKSIFSQTLLLSLIPSIIAQLHMVFGSKDIYDYDFFAAQILKSISYLVPFIGLSINYIETYKKEIAISEELDIQLKSKQKIEDTLKGVLDTSLNGIMSIAPIKNELNEVVDFRWTMINNKAEIDMEFSYEQLLGNRFYDILPNGHYLFEKYKKAYLTGIPEKFEIYSEHRKQYYEISVAKFADEVAVTFIDITNEKLGQDALLNYQRIQATSKFARLMTHEIRNPLTNILLSVEQLKSELHDNTESIIYLDILQRNTLRINELISEVMNASKMTELNLQEIQSKELIQECLKQVEDRLKLQDVKLNINFKHDVILKIDIEKMKIALTNIMLNAIEAMQGQDATLSIEAYKISENYYFEITDNGIGISPENQQKLFEPFYTNKSKGFGIGLTASQTIIFNHSGKINVKSTVGKGTTFTISLPLNW